MLPVKTEEQSGTDKQGNAMSADNDSAHDAEPVRDNPVVALVVRARGGDERAWAALVERYARWSGRSAAGTGWTLPTPPTSARTSGCCW
jgi:hypothetical protein